MHQPGPKVGGRANARFVAYSYCAMALFAAVIAVGVRFGGSEVGLSGGVAKSVSNGFAALGVFNLGALLLIEWLNGLLGRGKP